jgi:hypothetical protein
VIATHTAAAEGAGKAGVEWRLRWRSATTAWWDGDARAACEKADLNGRGVRRRELTGLGTPAPIQCGRAEFMAIAAARNDFDDRSD